MLFLFDLKRFVVWLDFGVGPLVGLDHCWVNSSTSLFDYKSPSISSYFFRSSLHQLSDFQSTKRPLSKSRITQSRPQNIYLKYIISKLIHSTENVEHNIGLQCLQNVLSKWWFTVTTPDLGANAFFCAYFAIFLVANDVLGFRHKTWIFSGLVAIGSISGMICYIDRIMLHSNPWLNAGFEIQICTLIFAPVSLPTLPRFKSMADLIHSHSSQLPFTWRSRIWFVASDPNSRR